MNLTSLHYAIEKQNVEIVKLLLNNEKIFLKKAKKLSVYDY